MSNLHETLLSMKQAGETLAGYMFEVWFLVTIGLLSLLGFFGKRTLKTWDNVIKSHVPNQEIGRRFSKVYQDMTSCQNDLKSDISEVKDSVSEVHTRIDDIYHVLIKEGSKRPARVTDRKKDEG